MPSLDETHDSIGTPLADALGHGLHNIDYNGTISFTKYRRVVMPADGFVFWVATYETQEVAGTLHVATDSDMIEDQSYDKSTLQFTTQDEVHSFHDIAADTVWVGHVNNSKFAINSVMGQYDQAGLFHYHGSTILPAFASQFIDSPAQLETLGPVTSSSLALFMAMPTLGSVALDWCPWPENVPVFPSFAVPDNQPPPYIAVHNDPASSTSENMGTLDPDTGSTSRLVREKVRLRLYGLPHQQADTILTYILRWSLLNTDKIGITNSPTIRDEKQPMADINALAMCKTIDLDVMYTQAAVRTTGLSFIRHASSSLTSPSLRTL